jgi:hypothetical protein
MDTHSPAVMLFPSFGSKLRYGRIFMFMKKGKKYGASLSRSAKIISVLTC